MYYKSKSHICSQTQFEEQVSTIELIQTQFEEQVKLLTSTQSDLSDNTSVTLYKDQGVDHAIF